ncbi:hypothetical protein DICPUDRAFT_84987 [Dictyostelium purpureum]|uniref:SUEL-type lectin domain-containing protein n=1 Tax=Dictyostelium purpureum TaxID=5786 RepID=F1A4C2_DICPU|nr:uncharacterized protein DICPUDRAFT_84987 [Dictyostelium purpureum]EGC28960.1 hypothetical protein DICPUDRAFT_84987 [Dictyostelium purpureum]|eukprot:XP_003294519.1 hypothetical protein DICPUDRAFT_84987 [Dictyostelium purpureum]
MNKFFIVLIIFIFLNSISNALEFRKLVYTKESCIGDPQVVYSGSECSPLGFVNFFNETLVSVGPATESSCKNAGKNETMATVSPSKNYPLNKCVRGGNGNHFYYISSVKGNPVSIKGYCTTYTYFGEDCDGVLVYSFQNGTCVNSTKESQFRKLVCTGKETLIYDCGSDSQCGSSSCYLSTTDSGKIGENTCNIKEIPIADAEYANFSAKLSYSPIVNLLSSLFVIFSFFYL